MIGIAAADVAKGQAEGPCASERGGEAAGAARPFIIRPNHTEPLRCPDPRPSWQGCDPATILLGCWNDGTWSMAVSVHISGMYRGRPLSEWSDGQPLTRYATRTDALDAALDEVIAITRGWAHLDNGGELSRIAEWAMSKRQQGDLFDFAA